MAFSTFVLMSSTVPLVETAEKGDNVSCAFINTVNPRKILRKIMNLVIVLILVFKHIDI